MLVCALAFSSALSCTWILFLFLLWHVEAVPWSGIVSLASRQPEFASQHTCILSSRTGYHALLSLSVKWVQQSPSLMTIMKMKGDGINYKGPVYRGIIATLDVAREVPFLLQ